MDSLRRYRALGSLCRQQAAYNPDQSWRLLAQAEHWEHRAQSEVSSYFNECNATSSSDLAKSGAPRGVTDSRWKAIAAA
jgi:hypothetical protein